MLLKRLSIFGLLLKENLSPKLPNLAILLDLRHRYRCTLKLNRLSGDNKVETIRPGFELVDREFGIAPR